MIGRSAMRATISPVSRPGPETPRNRSAPSSASSMVLSLVSRRTPPSLARGPRGPCARRPSSRASGCSRLALPLPSASSGTRSPPPPPRERRCGCPRRRFSASLSALIAAAAATIAVPCWSSWNTGIGMRSRQIRSTTKQSGALMSSRFTAPKVGASRQTRSASRSGSVSSTSMSKQSIPANFLNRTALPSITGFDACGPMLPRPSTAVPFEITATRLPFAVYRRASAGVLRDLKAGVGDAGRIGEREVAPGRHRLRRPDFEFPGPRDAHGSRAPPAGRPPSCYCQATWVPSLVAPAAARRCVDRSG